MTVPIQKILIIRLSSFGDICQCLFSAQSLKEKYPDAKIDFVCREDFADFLQIVDGINRTWSIPRKSGVGPLIALALQLRREKYDLIYDAHNNLRTIVLNLALRFFQKSKFYQRSKFRLRRILLLKFRLQTFPNPFRGGQSYLKPLGLPKSKSLGLLLPLASKQRIDSILARFDSFVCLAPHATWGLKELPQEFWEKLIEKNRHRKFVVLGGPGDSLPKQLQKAFPEHIIDLSGQLRWSESAYVVSKASHMMGVDTGLTHLADYLGVPATFAIGPSAFGYPTRDTSNVIEISLPCKPCTKDGRGECKNQIFKKCMLSLDPTKVQLGATI